MSCHGNAAPGLPMPCRLAALGIVTPLGCGVAENRAGLIAGDRRGIIPRDDLVADARRYFGVVTASLPPLPPDLARYDCRNNRIALLALREIHDALAAAKQAYGPRRIAVVMGSSTSGFEEAERAFVSRAASGALPPQFDLAQLEFGGLSDFVAAAAAVTGPAYAISTACSSGAKALVSARALLQLDLCDAVIVGGVDTLCRFTANGFASLSAMSAGLTNPMSNNRDGLNLGEGGALFLMTREVGGVQLLGAGESSDAHHMSAPHPQGAGARAAMAAALADARLAPEAIAYLNLHGTGTPLNDASESMAVAALFGLALPCSSTKPLTGHTLGASGAIEAGFLWLLLTGDRRAVPLPPHRFDGVRDDDLAALRLVGEGERLELAGGQALMSNSFGFGGSNCSLVLGGGAMQPAGEER